MDRLDEIVGILTRTCTPDEWEIIKAVRTARRNNSMPMTPDQKNEVLKLFELPITTPEGPYAPIDVMGPIKPGSRRRYARRGYSRDMTVTDVEAAQEASEATEHGPVRKESPAAHAEVEAAPTTELETVSG